MLEDDCGIVPMSPAQFEEFVAGQLLGAAASEVEDLEVTLHEKIVGVDGAYDFDATVRYRFAGMDFLVVVEAKLHRNRIKRELVQVLHQKVLSVGAHKGVMVATSPYQAGAVEFAKAHGIALVTVTQRRFMFVNRDPRIDADPGLVAYYDGRAGPHAPVLSVDEDHPRCAAELLLGRPCK